MTPPKTLLDTDVLSAFLKSRPVVLQRVQQYLTSYSQLSFSLMTRFTQCHGSDRGLRDSMQQQ